MEMVIRPATAEDTPALVRLMQVLGYTWQEDQLREHLQNLQRNQSEVLLAVNEDQPQQVIGCVNPLVDMRLAEGGVGEIVSLAVLDEYQGLGAGRLLLSAAERWLESRVDKIRIRANDETSGCPSVLSACRLSAG